MIRTASLHDLAAIRELLANANDAPYDLAAVAEEKCFGGGVAGAPAPRVFERDGRIAGLAVTCGKWLRILVVDRDARRRGIGTALLDDSKASVIAAEPGNYFTPGVWLEDEGTRAFLNARGCAETQSTWTLDVDLSHSTGNAQRATQADAARVLDFIEREFGRIWRFEVSRGFDRERPPVFIVEEEGAIVGFAAYDINNRGLGFFGPAGIAKSARGRGVGCGLVAASLADLRNLGYSRAVIPWTDAIGFYRKCGGAEPAHRFVAFGRSQP